jgi:hypothetical protein
MKTRMLATALESGRESSRRAQACGFVSIITVRRDGARSFCGYS